VRLGIDLDGVVADFNAGWIRLHRDEFGSDLHPEMVTTWDGLHELGGFADMRAFWRWARGTSDRPSIFRHLDVYPDALDTLHALDAAGHEIVIVTTKPRWARIDTLRWLADHELPTAEVHMTDHKHRVGCDVYLDDSPYVLPDLVRHRPDALVCRFVRPWNHPVAGAADVHDWRDFHRLVIERSPTRR
jgi:5'(3')-deoxyribonucleotidase